MRIQKTLSILGILSALGLSVSPAFGQKIPADHQSTASEGSKMNTNETRALVEAFIKAWIDRDPAAMSKLVTDDAVWVIPQGFRENAGTSKHVGGDNIVQQFTSQPGGIMASLFKLETLEFTERTLLVDGDKAAWFHTKSGDFLAGGRYSTEYVFRFTCADGKITRIVEYVDTLQVVNQLGGLPSSGQ